MLRDLSARRELYAYLLEEGGIEASSISTITHKESRDHWPLSFAQQRLWFLNELGGPNAAYNISFAVRLKGRLDVAALERSFTEIVRRHEVLRASFISHEGEAVQIIAPAYTVHLEPSDLSNMAGPGREQEIGRLVRQEARHKFDLEQGPLMRVHLLRLEQEEHVAVLVMHHIISDGWSTGVLVRELAGLYESYSLGQQSSLPELPVQYADYAEWQREWLQGEVLDEQLSYWRRQLEGAPAVLELATDRPRPAVQTFRGAVEVFDVPEDVTEALRNLCRRESATLFMVLLAGFRVLLSRYTGQQDIVVGTPVAGRSRIETEGLIGFFVNTLVLRSELIGDPTFREVVRKEREAVTGATAHQDLPFEKLVEELQPNRNLSHTPLFQVMFALQNNSSEVLSLPGLELSRVEATTGTSKFDLLLTVIEDKHKLFGSLEYNKDLFEEETVRRMLRHYRAVLEAAAKDPDQVITAIEILTAQERSQLLVEWNDTSIDFPQLFIHQFVQRQASLTPDATAVIFEKQNLSYSELNGRANQLAHFLMSEGVGPESIIGVCLDRSIEMIVALLGILKAGAAYLPLDPEYPRQRLLLMIEDSAMRMVLSVGNLKERLPDSEAKLVLLDADLEVISGHGEDDPELELSGTNLCYVIYTSGSTGKPKAAMNTHAAISNRLQWMQQRNRLDETDAVMQKTPYSFDVSVWELFWPLMYGARMVIARPGGHRDSRYMVELIREKEVTTIHFVPAMLSVFLEEEGVEECESLRRVICSGEALGVEQVERLHQRVEAELQNLYGPTEAAVDVTYWECERGVRQGSVPIGKAISNIKMRILDRGGQMVPVGLAGELHIGGVGVGRGYLNRPEATAEKYIPDNYSSEEGARLYRTGDLARYRGDGNIEYLGRIDQQVKLRGYRIELGEIEAVLKEHEKVQEAVVVVKEDRGGKRLIGYVAGNEREVSGRELRAYAKERLPEYMVPVIVVVEEIPLTPNGKVDRKRLEERDQGREEGRKKREARTGAEEVLAAVWAQVLNVESVGIEDNFFEMGGDSIRSIQVVAMAKQRGLSFSLQEMFQHQTIAELASEISRGGEVRTDKSIRTDRMSLISEEDKRKLPDEVEDAYPLTMLQAGMLFHMELTPDSPMYHNVDTLRLRMIYDHSVFREAVDEVVRRHATLRTSFDMSSYSEPLQLVHGDPKLEIGLEDISDLSEQQQGAYIDEFIGREKQDRFDHRKAPLIRFYVHIRGEREIQFTLTESHTINDGWSLHSTLAEIFEHYFALVNGEEPAKAEVLEVSFRDYVAMERAALENKEYQRYWDQKLDGLTAMHLPRMTVDNEKSVSHLRRTHHLELSDEVVKGLRRLAREAMVPVKSVLLAAHFKVMSLISGQSDVVTGLTCNGRPEEPDGEKVRGLFLNTLPLRHRLKGGTWGQLVKSVFEAEREMLPYRWYPMAAIQRRFGREQMFETGFNYLHFHVVEAVVTSREVEVLEFEGHDEANLALLSHFRQELFTGSIGLELEYNAERIGEDEIELISGCFERVIESMAGGAEVRYDVGNFLTAGMEKKLLNEWNDTKTQYENGTAHGLFERRVERTPDAVAVIHHHQQVTYGELNKRANQLAHYLMLEGAGPESLIGICVDRSIEMVVAVLGILKSGAAYVPLDPAYPKKRLAFMTEDSGIELLLSQQEIIQALPDCSAKKISLDAHFEAISSECEENPISSVSGNNAAYVLYTSGSTGRPKGVMVSHTGLVNYLAWSSQAYGVSSHTVAPVHSPLGFDLTITSLLTPLVAGGTVTLVDEEQSMEGLLDAIKAYPGKGLVKLTPSHLEVINEQIDWNTQREGPAVVVIGGEALRAESLNKIRDNWTSTRLFNEYGPTETVVGCCAYEVTVKDERQGNVPIGRPIGNAQMYVMDGKMHLVPVGVTGEIYIGGEGVARGYLGSGDLTAERFVPDPYAEGKRVYRTGDQGRYMRDGNIVYCGGKDDQVKIRGYRIEPAEIEAVLRNHERIEDAVVMVREDVHSTKRLIAYLTTHAKLTTSEIRDFTKTSLPDYMVPSAFVLLEGLPLTPNGKVDRRGLLDMEPVGQQFEVEYVAPQDQMEEKIAKIWQEVLGVEKVGIHDNFFDLGGHSITLIEAYSKLREVAGIEIGMIEMFRHPTIASLKEFIDKGEVAVDGQSQNRAENRRNRTKRQKALREKHRTAKDAG